MTYLWLKAFHIISVMVWIGGASRDHSAPRTAPDRARPATTITIEPLAFRNLRFDGDPALPADAAELERRVAERTNELRESLKELETFSYSVAHDLRSPIRAISGLSAVLLEEHRAQLGDEGVQLVARIAAKSTQMSNLIDALLNLSRLSQITPEHTEVNLSAIAAEIIEQQMEAEPDRVAHVNIAPHLKARGDAVLVRSVLDNLLRNAWKFCARREVTRIELGRETRDGQDVFFVRDNGCGFDMAMADQLFSPFRRLHSEAEFKGTGIGLSIVQRIAARHGGRVWVQAAPDEGATFYFTLSG